LSGYEYKVHTSTDHEYRPVSLNNGIYSEKCVSRSQCHHCVNIREGTYTNQDDRGQLLDVIFNAVNRCDRHKLSEAAVRVTLYTVLQ
jgi:hypothetical protein